MNFWHIPPNKETNKQIIATHPISSHIKIRQMDRLRGTVKNQLMAWTKNAQAVASEEYKVSIRPVSHCNLAGLLSLRDFSYREPYYIIYP